MGKDDKDAKQLPLVNFRPDQETLSILDALRRTEDDIPTRSEMLRRVVRRADPRKRERK